MKYTVNRGAQQIGQFELADIQALMNAGVILPTDLFWFQGMPEWTPVSSLFTSHTGLVTQAQPPALPAAQAVSQSSVIITKDIGPSCASCYSTDVMKASAAYELHVKQHSLSAGTLSGLRFWASGETTNKVGANCAPPAKPEKPDPVFLSKILAHFIPVGAVGLIGQGLKDGIDRGMGSIIGGLALCVVTYVFYRSWKNAEAEIESEHKEAMKKHRLQMADYDRTWRCNKCGVMYLT
jgi:hypothetical protein